VSAGGGASDIQISSIERRFRHFSGAGSAIDTGQERPITFRAIAEHAANDLIQRLP
jgi:hypothetical protein